MDEDYSAGPEIDEPVRERSNRHGSESSTLEIDVYVWRYALSGACQKRTNEYLCDYHTGNLLSYFFKVGPELRTGPY